MERKQVNTMKNTFIERNLDQWLEEILIDSQKPLTIAEIAQLIQQRHSLSVKNGTLKVKLGQWRKQQRVRQIQNPHSSPKWLLRKEREQETKNVSPSSSLLLTYTVTKKITNVTA